MGKKEVLLIQGWEIDDDDRISMVISEVKDLNIADVLIRYGVRPEKYVGNKVLSLCPFHMDEHVGSFSINPNLGICWCFACNTGGDAIKSMSKIWKKSYLQTALQIAADWNLITKDEFQTLSGKKYSDEYLDKKVPATFRKRKDKGPDNETLKKWTRVYEFMKKWFGLSEADRTDLKTVRGLSDERIEKDYFSINTSDRKKVSRFIYDLRMEFPEYSIDDLGTVPGFYLNQIKGIWQLSILQVDALAILLRNAAGDIIAVQTRDRNAAAGDGSRYRYLSFKCYKNSVYSKGGETVGTPIDTIIPEKMSSKPKIGIVEGRFKSEILASLGFISLSVQGVNNFKGIDKAITEVKSSQDNPVKDIYVFYDGDQLRNGAVFQAGTKLSKYLKETVSDMKIHFVVWDASLGKGIDDLILAGNKNYVKTFSSKVYEEVFDNACNTAIEESGLNLSNLAKITKEERIRFYDIFERETKRQFLFHDQP